ncbi:hypothetical protein LOK49_LG02G00226 [Camellia lanceoleosa]|uniref:Uncharacterized protein n=1 Tax=Camellia lanceoleosa TaxID=1840588 RepID=A0ACC0IQ32_9ERIC|nr:hypothetical protein LOK49_LG02G00226 [Camellia lanceoleosa]
MIGLMKSLSDRDLLKPNISLKVVLDEAHFDGLSKGPDVGKTTSTENVNPVEEVDDSDDELSSSEDEGEVAQPEVAAWANNIMTQGKEISRPRSEKESVNTGGIQGRFWRRKGKSGAPFRNGFQRSALVRAATMATSSALSISNEVCKQKKVRKEAEATMQMGIKLGLTLTGHEDEVVERIMQMENENVDKVKGQGVKPGA